jgi:hypothetical protein
MDLGFVVGVSGANADRYFSTMQDSIKTIINQYVISPTDTRLGLVDYNGIAMAQILFRENYDKARFLNRLATIGTRNKGELADGLRKVMLWSRNLRHCMTYSTYTPYGMP